MGVYIKGMTIEQLRRMGVAGIILSEERLVEVKEPHGDLIDRALLWGRCKCKQIQLGDAQKDALHNETKYTEGFVKDADTAIAIIDIICRYIDEAPTVIEAEDGQC